ncbi:Hypothetical protein BRZCDTV_189, partial [Brazilian cedratvirus IHUMI]
MSLIFASFEEKVIFYFQALNKLCLYGGKVEDTRLVVTFSNTCPRLLQVIKEKDGYLYRTLVEGCHY